MAQPKPVFGKFTDQQVLDEVQKMPFSVESGPFPKMSIPIFYEMHPMAQHLREGTKPALTVGSHAPNGTLVRVLDNDHSNRTDQEEEEYETLQLHDLIRSQDQPFVVLNFGSFT